MRSKKLGALKGCPFCGGRAYINEVFNNYYVECNHKENCISKCNTWFSSDLSLEKQIKKWNKRIKE